MRDTFQDPAAYLQRRVALFSGVGSATFAVVFVVDLAAGSAEGEPVFSSTRVASLAVSLSCAAIWLVTRRGELRPWQSRALELLGMGVATSVFATLPIHPPIPGAGGVMGLMAPVPLAMVVLLRAALIPSPPWLSTAVALAWGGLMTWASVLGWENVTVHVPGQGFDPILFPLVHNAFAMLGIALVAGVISRVVHGLQTRVREAMQLGQYTLESKIGEGGMGTVYRARHAMLRRPTAVKLLPPEKSSEQAIARFEREVQETSRLTHPNTVAIFDYGRTRDGVFYYAMEYLDGISLEDLVKAFGPQPPSRIIHVLTQAAEALAEAHSMGLVHRDVKPANIVLCERGGLADAVKVLDFGLVKDVHAPVDARVSGAGTICGTPLYMAPEVLTSPEAVDARSDLYALGAVGYYMLTGAVLFEGGAVEVFGHHLHTRPKPPSERRGEPVEADLEAVVMRCLEKRPEDRYESATALVTALQRCAGAQEWTRDRGRAWWDENRSRLAAHRDVPPELDGVTLTRGRGEA
jgi:serine/threonine-protein kinase